jgi:hypothetical protein
MLVMDMLDAGGDVERRARRRTLPRAGVALAMLCAAFAPSRSLRAQTDYYNTDRGRPLEIEDAFATERYAFELKLAPVRLERAVGGAYHWSVEPEIAYGILPRTHLEIGVPVVYIDVPGATGRSGIAGIDVSIMHNLNAETERLPALGLRADLLAPIGSLAPDRGRASMTGMATRTFQWMRVHVNGQYTFGSEPARATSAAAGQGIADGAGETPRWLAGIAADRTLPLRSLLLGAELFARHPLDATSPVAYSAGAGVRYQWSPTIALDAGVGRRFTGDDQAWYVTFGSAYAFALASLMPGGGR